MKVSTITLGCKVNQYETQAMLNQLLQGGFSACQTGEDADIILLNSCTVTSTSDHKVKQTLHKARREHPHAVIVLTGCMPQAFPELAEDLTDADIVLGNSNRSSLLPHILQYLSTRQRIIDIVPHQTKEKFESMSVENFYERTRAFIKIQDGCNRFCSYCIIPYARGRVRSRKMEEVLEEITNLTKHGCQEFVITGIHVTSYGKDLGDVTLIDLLEEIAKIPEVKRIRLGSLEPGFITKDTLDRLSKMESFCPHFHLSLQSGCDSVLKRMNRKYTTQDIREKCKAIREHFQYPALTTDIIVGFPGETEEEFEETRKFLEEIDLYEMHVFKYSIRKGTKAADMKPQINDQIKAKRSNVLLEMSKQHQKEFETKQLGMVKEVLIEEKMHGKDHYYTGHTKEYIKVALYSEEPLENKIVKVKLRQILDDGYVLAEC